MESLLASIRLVVATMLICVAGYAAVIWGVGQILSPRHRARFADHDCRRHRRRQPADRAEIHAAALLLAAAVCRGLQRLRGGRQQQIADEPRPHEARRRNHSAIRRHRRESACLPSWQPRQAADSTRISASTRPSIRRSASPRRAAFRCRRSRPSSGSTRSRPEAS